VRTLCPVIINPGYEAPEARVHASRVTCEAGVCLGKSRIGYGSALGEGISRDPLGEAKMGLMPPMGQYIQPSTGMPGRPTELPISVNLYQYALNDPLYWTDPLGLNVINFNISLGIVDFGGQWDINGFHPYAGVGLGVGASLTLNPDENSTVACHRWSGNVGAGAVVGVGASKDWDNPGSPGSWSWNYGLSTPGVGWFWNYTGN